MLMESRTTLTQGGRSPDKVGPPVSEIGSGVKLSTKQREEKAAPALLGFNLSLIARPHERKLGCA